MKTSSENIRRYARTALSALPIVIVVACIVTYALTFLPLSTSQMERSVAMMKHSSYFEIDSAGQPVAWFRAFGDSLSLVGLSAVSSAEATDSGLVEGVWVNRYDFFPSCRGRILMPSPDTLASRHVADANKSVAATLRRAIAQAESTARQLDRKAARLRYYIRTHNVNDDGYNTMAAFNAGINEQRENTYKLLATLRGIEGKSGVNFRYMQKYALLQRAGNGATRQKACTRLTQDGRQPFIIVQTADKIKPLRAYALHFHQLLQPSMDSGEGLVVAAHRGCQDRGFSTDSLRVGLSQGATTATWRHNLPPLFAPDGSPCFTSGGRLIGVSVGGAIVPTNSFRFAFNDLLP